jgi:RimJ/RimL family protein N-acetyltransferase
MDLQQFVHTHLPALERDEVRFNMLIATLTAATRSPSPPLAYWSLGAAGRCAARRPSRPIDLGALDKDECRRLAEDAISDVGGGIRGTDDAPHWLAEHAASLGTRLGQPIPQRIHVLHDRPRYPQASGAPRPATAGDAPLLHAWLSAFRREATPDDPPPTQEDAEKAAQSGRFLLWTVNGEPVAMAAVNRSLRQTGSIGAVYTPPEHRGRGYAGSVTAATAERIFADGKTAVSLYTDLRNPVSNRCYARIGFVAYCEASHYPPAGSAA